MKALVLIFNVAMSLPILTGCDDSVSSIDPVPETPSDVIVGYWNMTSIVKDGVDLTDDCTTRSVMRISSAGFYGDDYDVVKNDCLLT